MLYLTIWKGLHQQNILDSSLFSKELYQRNILDLKKDKNALSKLLAQHSILNNIAFNVVQTSLFILFIKTLGEYGLGYKIP